MRYPHTAAATLVIALVHLLEAKRFTCLPHFVCAWFPAGARATLITDVGPPLLEPQTDSIVVLIVIYFFLLCSESSRIRMFCQSLGLTTYGKGRLRDLELFYIASKALHAVPSVLQNYNENILHGLHEYKVYRKPIPPTMY